MRWSLESGSKLVKDSMTVPNEMGFEPTATLHSATANSTAVATTRPTSRSDLPLPGRGDDRP